jgi:O-antigen/teichoic acid export membrane protein
VFTGERASCVTRTVRLARNRLLRFGSHREVIVFRHALQHSSQQTSSEQEMVRPPAIAEPAPTAVALPGSRFGARTLRGSAWTLGGHAAGQLIRFANNIALTYLIDRELIGLIAIVHVFLTGLYQLSDFGVGPAIIQNARGDEQDFRDTAWTLHVMRGAAIWVLTFPLGPLLAWIYSADPAAHHLVWLVPTVGTTALIGGLHSTAIYTRNRHLDMRPIVILEVGSLLICCAVGLCWAYLDPSLWALVAGVLCYQVTHTVGSHLLGTRNRFCWDRGAAAAVARFGRWIWLSTLFTWMAAQVDRLAMPAILHLDGFAVYQAAMMIAGAVPDAAHLLGSRILFPALSDLVRRQDPTLGARLRRARLLMVLPAVAALLVLSFGGESLIRVLYPHQFHDAGWMLRLLAVGAIPQVLTASSWYALFAMGTSFVPMCLQAAKVVLKAAGMTFGYYSGGAQGVIGGLVIAEAVHYPIVVAVWRRYGLFHPQLDLPVLLGGAIAVGAFWT